MSFQSICIINMSENQHGAPEYYIGDIKESASLAMEDICRLYGAAHGIDESLAGDYLAGLEMECRIDERLLKDGVELQGEELFNYL